MSDLQAQLNQILSNPEALKQVQSLGEQLGLTQSEPPKAAPPPKQSNAQPNNDMMKMFTQVAPMLNSLNSENNTTALLHALRPFLSYDRQQKLDKAEKMLKIIKLMPILRENGLFF